MKTSFKVESDLKALDQILSYFDQLNQSWIPRKDWLQCQLALAEGFTNAVRHAHKDLPSETPVDIEITLNQQGIEMRIWDYRPPFDLDGVSEKIANQDNRLSGHGQGLPILQKIATYLSYTRTEDNRNCLLIVKQFAVTSPESQPMNEFPSVVSAQWLVSQLENPSVIIVDCRFQLADRDWGYHQYLAGHLPGAYFLDLNKDLSSSVKRHGGRHPLPDIDTLAEKLAELGIILGETSVIAYDDARLAFASRLWWLLRFLGHNRVALLDGGWQAWQAAGYPITTAIPTPKEGKFVPEPHFEWIVEIDGVKSRQNSSSVVIIDSRDSDRYRGERELIDPIAGHIPGAVNSPWQQVTDKNGYLRPLFEQQQLWQNYQPAEEIIVYCGSGVTACVNLFSLELAGQRNVKLYPGGWSDWCSYLT